MDVVPVVQVKKGPLAETSPMLNDISGVPGWSKVRSCAPQIGVLCRYDCCQVNNILFEGHSVSYGHVDSKCET